MGDFAQVLREFRIDEDTIDSVIGEFRQRGDQVLYEEFVNALIERPNESRRQLIQKTFKRLQGYNKANHIPLKALKEMYRARSHPEVKSGMLAEEEAIDEFTDALQMLIGKSNNVQKEDFDNYYTYVSFCTPSDKHFEALLNDLWASPVRTDPYVRTESPVEYGKRMRMRPVYNPVTGAIIDYGKYAKAPVARGRAVPERDDKELVETVRASLISRGLRGVLGLYRSFRVIVNIITR